MAKSDGVDGRSTEVGSIPSIVNAGDAGVRSDDSGWISCCASALRAAPTTTRVDVLARLLVVDGFTARTRTVLGGKDPRTLLALGLASPEYAVS